MGKVYTLAEVHKRVARDRKKGKVVVATNGCFDLLHVGHVRNLQKAKALGDVLVVGVNSDASVRANKGNTRPIIPAKERAEVIAALGSVDYVFIFSQRTPFAWIRTLRPDIHVKGGGEDIKSHPDFEEHKRIVEDMGGRMRLVPHHTGISTTVIIRKILKSDKSERR